MRFSVGIIVGLWLAGLDKVMRTPNANKNAPQAHNTLRWRPPGKVRSF